MEPPLEGPPVSSPDPVITDSVEQLASIPNHALSDMPAGSPSVLTRTPQMKHWPGNNNIADIFTKWLPRNEFQRYRSMLLNLPAQRKLGLPVDG